MKGGVKAEVDGSSFVPQPPDYGGTDHGGFVP